MQTSLYIDRSIRLVESEKSLILLMFERPSLFKKKDRIRIISELCTDFTQYDIVELALALKLTGKVKLKNGEEATFSDIVFLLEQIFNCNVNDAHKIWSKMFTRKKSFMPFLDSLRNELRKEDGKRVERLQ